MSLGREEFKAIDVFLRGCTVPILWEKDGQRRLCGTGTLFLVNDRQSIVTAAHIFKDENDCDLDRTSLGIPLDPRGPEILTFGDGAVYRMAEENDIGVISMDEAEFVKQIEGGWTFLSPANVGKVQPDDEEFLVSGYLEETTKLVGDKLTSGLNNFWTKRYSGDADALKQPVNFEVELFLGHHRGSVVNLVEKGERRHPAAV